MFARTARLLLRPGWAEDAPALTTAIAHESVAMRLARLPWPYTLSDAQMFLAQPPTANEPRFLIFDDPGGCPRLVGGIELVMGAGEAELGYWLTPAVWGHGYATEAGAAVCDLARDSLRLRQITSGHFVDNPGSGRVLAKLGFRVVGRGERPCRARGHPVASLEMALTLADERPLAVAA